MNNLQAIQGFGSVTADKLQRAGYDSYAQIASATGAELSKKVGISLTMAEWIIEAARMISESADAQASPSESDETASDIAEAEVGEADTDESTQPESARIEEEPSEVEMVEEDVLGIHRGIGFEWIIPIPSGELLALEVLLSVGNRTFNTLEKFAIC